MSNIGVVGSYQAKRTQHDQKAMAFYNRENFSVSSPVAVTGEHKGTTDHDQFLKAWYNPNKEGYMPARTSDNPYNSFSQFASYVPVGGL